MNQVLKKIGVCVGLVALSLNLCAKPIDRNTAITIGTHFLNSCRKDISTLNLKVMESSFNNLYILVPTEGSGFVIVAGDDAATPILGYSINNTISCDNPNLSQWLQMYNNTIASIRNNNISATEKIRDQWHTLQQETPKVNAKETTIGPLLTTQWNQSPFYNDLCPYDANEQTRVVAGCGAIATAQVMKYWNYPTQGFGFYTYNHSTYGTLSANFGNTTYDWEHMTDQLTSSSSATEIEAVATLVYHAAVALHMNFSPYNSSSDLTGYGDISHPAIDNALLNYFKYSPSMMYHNKSSYTDEEWISLMKKDLDQAMPIIYRGYDEYSGGHLFVCDGYDENNLFHFNWGWNGSGDGFFAINNLNPQSFDFSQYCMMVNNIHPITDTCAHPTITATSNNDDWGTATGSTTVDYGQYVTITATPNIDYKFTHWSDSNEYYERQFPAFGSSNMVANFAPIAGDTMYYCTQNHIASRGYGVNNFCYWGIAIPKTSLQPNHKLTSVEFFCDAPSSYTLYIISGDPNNTPMVTKTYHIDTTNAWVTLALETPVSISTQRNLNIVLNSLPSVGYPAAYSTFCGHTYSCLFGNDRNNMRSYGFGSFMIKVNTIANPDPVGIDTITEKDYTVTTNNDQIIITGAEGRSIQIFDIQGRRIFSHHYASPTESTTAPANGIYIVKVGNDIPQKALINK